jgi:hypothetical protein
MNDIMRSLHISSASVLLFLFAAAVPLYAQELVQPPVKQIKKPVTPQDEGVSSHLGGGVVLNNFGFGINGVYGRTIGPYTEVTFTTGITGIRYNSQQKVFNFSYFYGTRKSIINKYNRALGIPFMLGIKHRIFARAVSDNFRFFLGISGGPALALVFPYLHDADQNGYRTITPLIGPDGNPIKINGTVLHQFTEFREGFFKALGKTKSYWGATGSIKIGIDFGKKYKTQPTLSLGYFFYYFSSGLQLMDRNKPVLNNEGQVIGSKPFFGKKSFFGTPQITFTFSGWW